AERSLRWLPPLTRPLRGRLPLHEAIVVAVWITLHDRAGVATRDVLQLCDVEYCNSFVDSRLRILSLGHGRDLSTSRAKDSGCRIACFPVDELKTTTTGASSFRSSSCHKVAKVPCDVTAL